METPPQKSIEQYFADFNITDPDLKAKLLPEITRIIYDRNIYVVEAEKQENLYKKNQILNDVMELDNKIKEIIQDVINEQKK